MTTIPIRNPYERHRHYTHVYGESRTHQSHAESCDINNIIKRFDNTGELPPATREPQYADVTALQGDLTERINQSRETLDTAGRQLEENQAEQEKLKTQKQLELEQELADLKAAQSHKEPSAPSPD